MTADSVSTWSPSSITGRHRGWMQREVLVRRGFIRLPVVPFQAIGQTQLFHEPDDALGLRHAEVMDRYHYAVLSRGSNFELADHLTSLPRPRVREASTIPSI